MARTIKFGLAGVVVALIVIGQVLYLVHAAQSGSLSDTQTVPGHGSLRHRLDVALTNALGPSDRAVRRFHISALQSDPRHHSMWAADITWAINNDLSSGTVGNGAASDVYAMVRNVYTAHLPISTLRMNGTYPMRGAAGRSRETVVMRLEMRAAVVRTVASAGWDNLDPQTFWPLVDRLYVNPAVQPMSSE